MADEELRKIDYDKPISAETLFQLINSSIQSGKPLWLQGAYLREANLSGAILYRANLREARLSGADLRGADLWGANLLDAKHDDTTVWPEGIDPVAAGAVLVDDMRKDEQDG